MHTYLIATITLNAVAAGKVLGISASVYAILQVVKKTFPSVSGKFAVGMNVILSVSGSMALFTPDKLFSIETVTALIIAGITAAGSAGIHGTVQNVAPPAVQAILGQVPIVLATDTTNATTQETMDHYKIK